MLEIRVLGQFEVRREGETIEIPSRPAQTLLAYLALNPGTPHRREKLAGLLWPDSTDANARANLRAALWRIRKSLEVGPDGQTYLQADGINVAFDASSGYWLDAEQFAQAPPAGETIENLAQVASAYRGELLPGFYDEWVAAERERLHAAFEQRMRLLMEKLVDAGRWQEALEWGERWLAFGSASEAAYRGLMAAYAGLEDLTSAATVYERCTQALRRDLDVEPSAETQSLYSRILRQKDAAPRGHRAGNLPAQSTPFVGREPELAQIARILADPECRLLTLIGPGGIGKTRLALEAAHAQQHAMAFPDGVYFASLASLQSPAFLPSAIGGALNLTFHGLQEPRDQLAGFLRDKRLLLLLDNFEHVLAGAQLLVELQLAAPGLKLLVTSREPLRLQGEWLFEVGGLAYPAGEPAVPLEEYAAVAVFLQTARRVHPEFALSAANAPAVVRICRLAAGVPLAVELAARWTRHLPVGEIAQEIERSLNLLTTSLRDVPERHRSMRAVFDHSWRLLPQAEQAVLRRLSVFRGGFDRAGAASVAEASLAHLSALVDKSLVTRLGARFDLHELLRQYAVEALAQAGELEVTRRRHSDFVLAWVLETAARLQSQDEAIVVRRLEVEHDNARGALEWSLSAGEAEAALRLATALAEFWWRRGHIVEGYHWLARALEAGAGVAPELRSAAQRQAARLAGEAGDLERASRLAEEALRMARQAGDRHAIALAQSRIGWAQHLAGDERQAIANLEVSNLALRELGDKLGVATNLLLLADAYMRLDDLARGAALWEESLVLFRQIGDDWGIAFALGGRGDNALRQGEYARAAALLKEALALQQARGHEVDLAYNLEAQAILAAEQGRPERAARLWGAAEALREAVGAPVPPGYRLDYAPHWAKARAAAGQDRFEAAWAAGRRMELAEAVAHANASTG